MNEADRIEQLVLPPIRALLKRLPGVQVHADPYTSPFEPYHHHATGAQTWDLDAIRPIADAHPGPALDVGCGGGRLALALAAAGHEVTAVDTSAPAIARLRRAMAADPHAAARVEAVHGDVTDPDLLPHRRFRLVVLGDLSINMFAAPETVIRLFAAIGRLLTEDGVFCLPVLRAEGLASFARLRGMTAIPFPDDAGRQRLLWIVMRHEQDGPYFHRTLFLQDGNAADGTLTGHVTAVRERLWTPETLRPHLDTAGLRVAGSQPLTPPATSHAPAHAALLTIRRIEG